jgi:cytochrome P450
MMATEAIPTLTPEMGTEVIDPQSYAEWDGLLDTFDWLRDNMPVARVVAEDGSYDPFWLITRYDDAMRISKDNKTFLNHPRSTVFTTKEAIAFSERVTGSKMLVDSLVTFDAPIHPKYRRLTQDWFMPKNLKTLEAEIESLARTTVDRLVNAGTEADFVPLVSAPYPLHVVMQILGVPEEDEQRMLFLTQQMFGGQDEDHPGRCRCRIGIRTLFCCPGSRPARQSDQ